MKSSEQILCRSKDWKRGVKKNECKICMKKFVNKMSREDNESFLLNWCVYDVLIARIEDDGVKTINIYL